MQRVQVTHTYPYTSAPGPACDPTCDPTSAQTHDRLQPLTQLTVTHSSHTVTVLELRSSAQNDPTGSGSAELHRSQQRGVVFVMFLLLCSAFLWRHCSHCFSPVGFCSSIALPFRTPQPWVPIHRLVKKPLAAAAVTKLSPACHPPIPTRTIVAFPRCVRFGGQIRLHHQCDTYAPCQHVHPSTPLNILQYIPPDTIPSTTTSL